MKKQTLPHDPRAHSCTLGCKDNTVRAHNNKGVKEYAEKYKEINFADYNGILPLIEKFVKFASTDDLRPNMCVVYYNAEKNYLAATNGYIGAITYFTKQIFNEDKYFNSLALPCESDKFPNLEGIICSHYTSNEEKKQFHLDFNNDIDYMSLNTFNGEKNTDRKAIQYGFIEKYPKRGAFNADYLENFSNSFGNYCAASCSLDNSEMLLLNYGGDKLSRLTLGVIMPILV